MSLRLLVDEDSQAKALVAMLRGAGHDVRTAAEEDLMGADDTDVLRWAHEARRAVVTRNADDFAELHDAGIEHSGVLAIYRERSPAKSMSLHDVVRAIGNLDASGLDMTGEFVPLNAWNY